MDTRYTVGSLYRCVDSPVCYFKPGSVVEVTEQHSLGCYVRLAFGDLKDDVTLRRIQELSGIYCLPSELVPLEV
jgi:hypothetical protein